MKIKDQVCSLELAVKLHKLGVASPSLFYTDSSKNKNNEIEMWETPDYCQDNINRYSVAELGELLPNQIDNGIGEDPSFMHFDYNVIKEDGYMVYIEDFDFNKEHIEIAKTEANARALMLIYLIENKLLESNSEEQTKVHQQEESL